MYNVDGFDNMFVYVERRISIKIHIGARISHVAKVIYVYFW